MEVTEPFPCSLYGKGFVGSWLCETYPAKYIPQDRDDLFPKYPNIVYGISTVHNYHVYTNPYLDVETNQILFMKVLEACRREYGTGFVFNLISSWFVYGRCVVPAHEHYTCKPSGFYGITAYARELMLRSYCETFHIPFRIFRLANVLGVGDGKVSKRKNALQYMIRELVRGREVGVYRGHIVRDYIDVRDVVRAITMAISCDGTLNETINISNGQGIEIADVVSRVARSLSRENLVSTMDVPEFHKVVQVESMWLNNDKLKKLGYEPKYKLYETLNWIIEDYQNE